ncbi:HpcH/HpaI aldolase family protein [Haloplanus halophilus]|uniref:HpcH/HpaI aldolase family protein n=1 Tax=Haloplanus halophilus TaxID=2949993 RepID=UPI00203B0DEF|nr:aldolase/citrate lyase family protein [Haloplanus sp. GDY1]
MATDPETGIERLRAGEPVAAGWITMMHPAVAEITADTGYRLAFVDTEHTTASLSDVETMVRALETGGDTDAVVRVPSDDPTYLKRVLDVGVDGVMVPMIETAAEAEGVVDATRYPPAGSRGTGAARAQSYGADMAEYVDTADERLLRIVQIETPRAVENAADIAAVDGIDALFVGPVDLSTGLGDLGNTESEAFVDAVETVLDAAEAAGKPVGTLATSEADIEYYEELGFDWQIVGVDVLLLRERTSEVRSTYADLVSE